LDTFVAGMGGTIVRRPLDEVVAELEAQQAAAEEAEKAARKAIREQKKQERKETCPADRGPCSITHHIRRRSCPQFRKSCQRR
jgi:hypothetical protein